MSGRVRDLSLVLPMPGRVHRWRWIGVDLFFVLTGKLPADNYSSAGESPAPQAPLAVPVGARLAISSDAPGARCTGSEHPVDQFRREGEGNQSKNAAQHH